MIDISQKLIGKIGENIVAILSEIDGAARKLELPFFIVGATARDIILQHVHGIDASRATIDIDIGLHVSGWDQFQILKQALVSTGRFSLTSQMQRLSYENAFPVDIVPFGGIAGADSLISWPPGHDIEMSVAGFIECYESANTVKIRNTPELAVKVVGLAGLAMMKIVSWKDGLERRGKDATDLFLIIRNYIDAGNVDRFFEEGTDILEGENYDYDLASARFLGREIGRIARPATKTKLFDILKKEADSPHGHRLAMTALSRLDPFQSESYEKAVACFDALLRGISECDDSSFKTESI